jgi:hypothetical protein
MSNSLSVELIEARRQLASDFPDVGVVLERRTHVLSNGQCGPRPVLMAAVLAYRAEARELWGPVILELLAPALIACLQCLQAQPPVMDSDDLRQQLVLEVLRAAATMPMPANPSYLRRRLMARASLSVRRWLEREGRRQRSQRSYETLEAEGK